MPCKEEEDDSQVETQLLIANKIGCIKNGNDRSALPLGSSKNDNEKGPSYEELLARIQEIEKQLAGLIRSLREK